MQLSLKSIRDVSVAGKRVLVRVDFNVPIHKGKISDSTRLDAALPTIQYLKSQGAKIILASHLGRPDSVHPDPFLSLKPVAQKFSKLLGAPVKTLPDCVGPEVVKVVSTMCDGDVVLLENTRFNAGEKRNDPDFTQALASLADLFVQDAFGTCHRAHASTVGVAKIIPAYAGFLLEKEVLALTPLLHSPRGPLILVVGGAKIDTKIGVLKHFVPKASGFLIGGGLANTFLYAAGHDVGDSLCEKNKIDIAQEIMLDCEAHKDKFLIPRDVIVSDSISDRSQTVDIPIEDVEMGMKILDIGSRTVRQYSEVIKTAGTIVWNGPMGLYEMKPFQQGTRILAKAIAVSNATTILGGGDTIDAIKRFGHSFDEFTHVSTGGGAMLEFLEGKTLPGVEVVLR